MRGALWRLTLNMLGGTELRFLGAPVLPGRTGDSEPVKRMGCTPGLGGLGAGRKRQGHCPRMALSNRNIKMSH